MHQPIISRCLATLSVFAMLAVPSAALAVLHPGDLIVSDFVGNDVEQFSPNGTLLQTYSASGSLYWGGSAVTPGGNIVATNWNASGPNGANIFSPSGTLVTSFLMPQVDDSACCSVFADGTIAVAGQSESAVFLYGESGNFVRALNVPSGAVPFGNAVAPDNTLWVAGISAKTIYHFNENGTLLGSFSTSVNPQHISVDPVDNTLWVADRTDDVLHFSESGALLGEFPVDFAGDTGGLAWSPNGDIYVVGATDGHVSEFSQAGALLGTFPLPNQQVTISLTVVMPEPACAGLLLIGLPTLLRRRARG